MKPRLFVRLSPRYIKSLGCPAVVGAVSIPVIAAGGIATGRQMLAAMVLGAEGVQIETRFVASQEASSHPEFKQAVVKAAEGDTQLSLKKLTPVRLLRNHFSAVVQEAEARGAGKEELLELKKDIADLLKEN